MSWPKMRYRTIAALFIVLVMLTGCMGSKTTVQMMPEPEAMPDCHLLVTGDLAEVSDEAIAQALDASASVMAQGACWKTLMEKALQENREIPMPHLAKAVHVFNRHETQALFSSATYQYLRGVVNGKGTYRHTEKQLMEAYLRYCIKNAKTRHDAQLEKARLVCSRLDSQLYNKFFR